MTKVKSPNLLPPHVSIPKNSMSGIVSNPGMKHISSKIFGHLDEFSLLSASLVNESWFNAIKSRLKVNVVALYTKLYGNPPQFLTYSKWPSTIQKVLIRGSAVDFVVLTLSLRELILKEILIPDQELFTSKFLHI